MVHRIPPFWVCCIQNKNATLKHSLPPRVLFLIEAKLNEDCIIYYMVEKINKNILGEILDKYNYWISTNDWTDVFNSVQAQYSDKTFTQFVAVLDELEIEYLPYINKIYRQMYTGRENLKLELPDNIEYIWPDAFAATVGAKVYIPKSVSRVGIQHYTDDLKFFFEGDADYTAKLKGNWLAAFDPDKTSNSFYTETTRQEFRGM